MSGLLLQLEKRVWESGFASSRPVLPSQCSIRHLQLVSYRVLKSCSMERNIGILSKTCSFFTPLHYCTVLQHASSCSEWMPFPAFKPSEPPGQKAHRVSFLNFLMFNSLWAGFRLCTLVWISVYVSVGLFQYTPISSLSGANEFLTIKSLPSQLSPL